MTIHPLRGPTLLHVIAATLSLLLLAGMFGAPTDGDDDAPAPPAGNAAADHDLMNDDGIR